MKHRNSLKSFFLFTVLSILSFNLYAQTGKITGKVTDGKTGETLIGLTVKIVSLTKGASTDVEGRYTFSGLPVGKYTLSFSYVGYKPKNVSDVDVTSAGVTALDVVMEESNSQSLNEVVITATARQESLGALYAQQKNSIRISDGIAADAIRRSPDKSTGEVLKRVSGTSIQDNKFVIVRGLGDRYNTTMLNNAVLPSSEPDKKAFSFDVVPSNLVDNIIISKTATPDLPGDFAGGAVQITTKDFPDKAFAALQIGSSYNTQTTSKLFKQGSSESLDAIGGYNKGERAIPAAWNSVSRADYVSLPTAQQVAITETFNNTYGVKNQYSGYPAQNLQFTFGNTKTNENNDSKWGYIASVSYRNGVERFLRNRSNFDLNGSSLFNFNDVLYNYTNNLGGLLNLSYSYKSSKFSLKNLYSNSFSNNFTDRDGQNNESGFITNIRSSQTDVSRSGLFSSVFEGQHFLEKNKINIDYNISYGYSYKDQPDQRILEQLQRPDTDPRWYISLSNINQPAIQNAGRVFSDLKENIYGGKLNVSFPYQLFKQSNKFKAGYLTSFRDRTFKIDALGYALPQFGQNFYIENGLTPDNIFSSESIQQRNIILSTITSNSFSYDGGVFLNAGYIMSENKFSDKLRLIIGARVENYQQKLTPIGSSGNKQDYNNTDILPSANLTYALTDKSNLRVSGSQTVSRPELRELADFLYYDFVTDFTVRGNPTLSRTLTTNADVRYEIFPSAGQIFSVSGFYKYFKNPIEQTNGGNQDFSFQNADNATDYGAELEFRKKLDFISKNSFVKNLTFYANASYIKSEVTVAGGNPDRPLQGQSPYLLNGGLQFANTKGDFSMNLLYNRIGQRLVFVGVQGGLDTYERPRDLVDFQVSKRIIKSKAEIRFSVSDIFAQRQRLYYNYNTNTNFNSSTDRTVQSTLPGRNISLNFLYNF